MTIYREYLNQHDTHRNAKGWQVRFGLGPPR